MILTKLNQNLTSFFSNLSKQKIPEALARLPRFITRKALSQLKLSQHISHFRIEKRAQLTLNSLRKCSEKEGFEPSKNLSKVPIYKALRHFLLIAFDCLTEFSNFTEHFLLCKDGLAIQKNCYIGLSDFMRTSVFYSGFPTNLFILPLNCTAVRRFSPSVKTYSPNGFNSLIFLSSHS